MRLSDIKELMNGTLEVWELRVRNKELFESYKNSLNKMGKSIHVNVIEDQELLIGKHELNVLCNFFIKDEILTHELAFLADVLGLSQNISFESEDVEECISHMTDPEVNGKFTKENAIEIITF